MFKLHLYSEFETCHMPPLGQWEGSLLEPNFLNKIKIILTNYENENTDDYY